MTEIKSRKLRLRKIVSDMTRKKLVVFAGAFFIIKMFLFYFFEYICMKQTGRNHEIEIFFLFTTAVMLFTFVLTIMLILGILFAFGLLDYESVDES